MTKAVDSHRAAHEEWNRRDFAAIGQRCVPNFTYVDHPRGITIKTRDEFVEWVTEWADAFSDGRITEPRYLDAGDTSVAMFRALGTNDGPLGFLPATGRSWTGDFCEYLAVDADGKFVSGGVYYDQLGMLAQLGHIEPPVE